MVKVSSASGAGEDTTSVALECSTGGINRNASWLLIDSSLKLSNRSLWNSSVGGGINLSERSLGLASTGSGNVWVVFFELLSVLFSILESIDFETSVTSAGSCVTVDELRFRELEELSGLDEMSTLHSSGGGESPAGSTLTLVLDWVDGTLGSPVDTSGEVFFR